MDVQDQTQHTNPSAHESGPVVQLCHRCGWPFPNPHPSAKHRRSHKKICGTIEGYTTLIDSEAVSDDEPHLDDDKEKTPSPKIEKKKSVGDSGGGFSRSEEDLLSDSVTGFSDSGVEHRSVSSKTLDRDVFFSFNDAENGGSNEVLDASIDNTKAVDADVTLPGNVEKPRETEIITVCDSSEARLELPYEDGKSPSSVKDRVVGSRQAESINVVKAGEEKVQESRTSETEELNLTETVVQEAKSLEVQASDTSITTSEISASVGGYKDRVKQEKLEIIEGIEQKKFKSGCENVSEAVKKSEIIHGVEEICEEIKQEKSELDHEHFPEVAKESEIDQEKGEGASEVIRHEKFESDHELASEDVKEPQVDQSVPILTEKEILGEPDSEKCSSEHVQEVVEKMEHLGGAKSENFSIKNTQEVVEEPESAFIEKDKDDLGAPKSEICSSEQMQMQDVVKELDSVVAGKEELDAPKSEECSNEQTRDIVTEPGAVLIEKEDLGMEKSTNEHTPEVVKKPDTVLTEKEDLGAPNLESLAKEHTPEVVEGPSSEKRLNEHTEEAIEEPKDVNSGAEASVIVETITPKEAEQSAKDLERTSDHSIANVNNDSGIVSEPIVEGTGKPMTNQDSVADLSVDSGSHNSLEGNWGSVSVLSTASIDAETIHSIDKSRANSGKPVAASNSSGTSDVFDPPSFMTLVQPEGKDQKPSSAEGQLEPPKSEAQQAGWFPTLTSVSNESEGRKRNEEVIAKVTNWSITGKHSTPLKSLLGEAKSPNAKQPENMVEKDEGPAEKGSLLPEAPAVNEEFSSPPKLIEDGKKGKKVKGRGSWMPFVCCSSVNVN